MSFLPGFIPWLGHRKAIITPTLYHTSQTSLSPHFSVTHPAQAVTDIPMSPPTGQMSYSQSQHRQSVSVTWLRLSLIQTWPPPTGPSESVSHHQTLDCHMQYMSLSKIPVCHCHQQHDQSVSPLQPQSSCHIVLMSARISPDYQYHQQQAQSVSTQALSVSHSNVLCYHQEAQSVTVLSRK